MTENADPEDDKKQSKTFSVTKGVLRRLQKVMEDNGLGSGEQSELVDFLLDRALEQVEEGAIKLPIEHVAVLKKPR